MFVVIFVLLSALAGAETVSTGDVSPEKAQRTPPPAHARSVPQQEPGRVSPGTSSPRESFVPQAFSPPTYRNGAGETGVKWDSGTVSPRDVMKFDLEGAGQCGPGQDLWTAAGRVMSEAVIPVRRGYDLMAPSWPRLVPNGTSWKCDFGGAVKKSMCTSATAAAICQHISDLLREKRVQLSDDQIAYLNSRAVKAAINGNTFSVARLIQLFGGQSVYSARSGGVQAVLAQARTGDLLRFDRTNGTGHSTIFKEIKGPQFCYWTSNTATAGVGVQCEYIGVISQAVVSRFPADVKDLGGKIETMRRELAGFSPAVANSLSPQAVAWSSSLDCEKPLGK